MEKYENINFNCSIIASKNNENFKYKFFFGLINNENKNKITQLSKNLKDYDNNYGFCLKFQNESRFIPFFELDNCFQNGK